MADSREFRPCRAPGVGDADILEQLIWQQAQANKQLVFVDRIATQSASPNM